ncbi:MAG TPA: winged helix-turn-helix domain-containing protein [Usitatibacter sp.]|nr:winged helix-turn-helix domain-containing protein [Usitatibacter sp.]
MATTYRFGEVEVRPAERQLLVAGHPAAIGARAFDVLLALIDHRDRVLSKTELLDLVWPGLVVEENNLQVQVSTLRKLLGAQAVATIPGRGYRFTLVPEGSDAAPSCPLPARTHNLPAPLNSFIGREAEIAEVKALLAASRLVTLTSVGGTGKTRLSLQLCGELLEEYPDGIWFVELASLADERRVAQVAAFVLEVTEEAGKPVIDALAKAVRDKAMLLVLDNCEHLLHGCAELAKRLLQAGPRIRILASSREPLHVGGEAVYRVPALATAQAIRLFVERARAADSAFLPTPDNSPTIVEICKRLDGIPLAIELAAARVRAFSVDKIAARLDDRFRLLTGGDQTALPRQQTLRASIDWSYELLSAPERALLRRLAIFAGGWTLEAAEAVAGDGETEQAGSVLELLTNLVEKSLVALDYDGERYHLLETVRQYAFEQLQESGEADAIRDRHLAYYMAFATRARPELVGPQQAAWLGRLDDERENLLSAHSWCDRASNGEEFGLRLVAMLKQYWMSRGMLGLAYGVMLEALARAPGRNRARARTLFDAGQIGYFMGLYREARIHLEEGIAIGREIGDKLVTGWALQPLGMACLGQGDLAAARAHLDEALVRARELQDPRQIAAAINAMAQLHRVERNFDAAEPLFEHFLELARELEDRESIAIGLLNLAMTSIERGNDARACRLLSEALAIVFATGSKPAGQSVLEVCAGLAGMRSDWSRCARMYGVAEAQAALTGFQRDPADAAFLAPWIEKARAAHAPFDHACAGGRALPYAQGLREARDWLGAPPVSS